ncbi:MAG: glycosyltransferase family 39 protein [Methylophilaceae bacterium]|nr:glycosyltransferase family 39 protein [Methylophilaceae bacterium]
MSIELEHDWQSVFATPRPRLGERAKVHLLLLLCGIWIIIGLVGHNPWKPDELQTISVIKHFHEGGDWLAPAMAGEPFSKKPPLYYLSAAAFASLFTPLLPFHDAARLATGLWMAITLVLVGLTGRELWGAGCGRQATLIFLGSIGLVFSAHTLNPDVAGLTGYALVFYGLALTPRKPLRAGLILGTGAGIGFLAKGPLPAEIAAITALLLPLLFCHWRRASYLGVLLIACVAALPWIAPWLAGLKQQAPEIFKAWLASQNTGELNFAYFAKTLSWYAWPALPLAAWALWRMRPDHPSIQLALLYFLVMFVALSIGADNRDIHALPLLLPLAMLATPAVDTLRRGAASALDWFGIMLFGTLGFLVWLGWFAMVSGVPTRLAMRMHKLSPTYVPHFDWLAFLLACAITAIWAAVVFKANKRSNRAAVTDWAVGMTLAWGLLMTLWLPWLDAAKSYAGAFESLRKALPAHYACIIGRNIGETQRAALDYHANVRIQRFEITQSMMGCDLYLIQHERGMERIEPGPDWRLIWEGRRPTDRRESFRLYQRIH